MKTSTGLSKFNSMENFDYRNHQTAAINHLEII